jgi:hypothetical protein
MALRIHPFEDATDLTIAVRVALADTLEGARLVPMDFTTLGVELNDGRTFRITVEGFDLKRWLAEEEAFQDELEIPFQERRSMATESTERASDGVG